MKLFAYDIWDGDKGIIFAENEDQAMVMFKKCYDNDINIDGCCESGDCRVDFICDIPSEPRLQFIFN